MPDHIEFVEELIYGSRLAPEPNHRDWVDANPAPSGSAWISHHLDLLLPSFKAWLVIEHLPPLQAWDGRVTQPWGPSGIVELTGGLDGSWTGIADLNDLGAALFARFATVAGQALELNGRTKAPFSYRFWGYLQWAWTVRERFLGRQVFPVGTVFDRDGTPLSSLRFTDAFNTGHRAWHGAGTPAVAATPGFRSTAGQVSTRGLISNSAEDFIVFHREHTGLFQRWLERQGQPRLRPVDMGGPDGWPESGPVPPVPPPPWAATEAAVTPVSALHGFNSLSEIGSIEPDYYGRGHVRNSDLRSLPHNNYSHGFTSGTRGSMPNGGGASHGLLIPIRHPAPGPGTSALSCRTVRHCAGCPH